MQLDRQRPVSEKGCQIDKEKERGRNGGIQGRRDR